MNEELARVLPPPPERDVPPGRLAHHKDRLMQLIDDDRIPAPHAPTTARQPRVQALRPALWMPAAALALAGALTVGLVTNMDSGYGLEPSDTETAALFLDRIADVAAQTEVTPVHDDQLVYVKSLTAGAEAFEDGPFKPEELHQREVWVSQEPGPVKQLALHYEAGGYSPVRELLPPGSPGTPAGIDRPTYKWLAALPTDPDELLTELYRLTGKVEGQEKAQAVFDRIGELLGETIMPPATAAALYEAAAKIPGVTLIEDAVDPAGRHGVGIRRVDERAAWATEWIFDRDTLTYLGERSYLTADGEMGKKGMIMSENAVLKRGVVDRYRERPGA
ncbi:CU044_5270 family protein [Streptomyces adelaidensis]|uniref:CU044_5270 family protein n=1 Tax=Streptomyces adelaidensis TaxID=2796465 RepID=UPI001906AF7E|nr:CU044_5270 family protein [Streptomyces adelaidensis]